MLTIIYLMLLLLVLYWIAEPSAKRTKAKRRRDYTVSDSHTDFNPSEDSSNFDSNNYINSYDYSDSYDCSDSDSSDSGDSSCD